MIDFLNKPFHLIGFLFEGSKDLEDSECKWILRGRLATYVVLRDALVETVIESV